MLAILQMWRANLAIELEVLQMEWATFIEELYQDQFQIFALGWIADYPDPENFLDSLFHSLSSDNNLGYSNDEVDRLLDDASRELNQESRYDLYQGAEQLILARIPHLAKTSDAVNRQLSCFSSRYMNLLAVFQISYMQ